MMRFRPCTALLTLALGAALCFSCKKEEEESSVNAFSGTLTFNMPEYVAYGQVFHLVPGGVSRTDDTPDQIGYSYEETLTGASGTLRAEADPLSKTAEFDFEISKDTVGTFTFTYYAFADGYAKRSAARTFYVVNPVLETGSLSGLNLPAAAYIFTDARDGQQYPALDIDGTSWMLRNLAYAGDGTLGTPYAGAELMSEIYGRYYTWTEATTASPCPAGWRLPTDADWVAIGRKYGSDPSVSSPETAPGAGPALMSDASFNRERMWARPSASITGESGLCCIPTGYALASDGGFSYTATGGFAVFWTADDSGGLGLSRYVNYNGDGLYTSLHDKNDFACTIRCVK
ncbi:MAG: hypothetical protein IJV01_03445 [Bacteroidales bacterium]|nr:hypothetical protein [Bacteroidales bacterium]